MGELVFNGETSLANWIEIFKLVGYIYDDNGSSGSTRSLIFSLSNNIPYNHPDGADHFYNFIAKDGVDFDDALDEAKSDAKMLFGMRGYLATVTVRLNRIISNRRSMATAGWGAVTGWKIRISATAVMSPKPKSTTSPSGPLTIPPGLAVFTG